jgi:hypothetical protein
MNREVKSAAKILITGFQKLLYNPYLCALKKPLITIKFDLWPIQAR